VAEVGQRDTNGRNIQMAGLLNQPIIRHIDFHCIGDRAQVVALGCLAFNRPLDIGGLLLNRHQIGDIGSCLLIGCGGTNGGNLRN
jgi:hypothetical protein